MTPALPALSPRLARLKAALPLLTFLMFVVMTSAAGCFTPQSPNCAFACGAEAANANHCPSGYTCNLTDNYCHLNGFTGSCGFPTFDLESGPDSAMDMSVSPDQRPPAGDMTTPDAGAPDASHADAATPPPDLATPPDATLPPPDLTPLADLTPLIDSATPDLVLPPDLTTDGH